MSHPDYPDMRVIRASDLTGNEELIESTRLKVAADEERFFELLNHMEKLYPEMPDSPMIMGIVDKFLKTVTLTAIRSIQLGADPVTVQAKMYEVITTQAFLAGYAFAKDGRSFIMVQNDLEESE